MTGDPTPALVLETLLKRPGQIIYDLFHARKAALLTWLFILGILGVSLYGVVVGAQAGREQVMIAPAKLGLAAFLSMLICLPSLYIFTALDGIDAEIRGISGSLFAAVCLCAILLVGFAPVAWIFSQSTDSVLFMGTLHLVFWAIGIRFGLRLIEAMSRFLGGHSTSHLKVWSAIFILVCLQMMTALRPIITTSATFFPVEKKFFLVQWWDCLTGTVDKGN
ncbi:MAG: ABC-type transport system, permease component [Spartobacteria bacterium]|nr:ABC-type transport system, permease component [Spartobacteria bacterium]